MIFSDNFQLVSLGKVYLIYKVFISEKNRWSVWQKPRNPLKPSQTSKIHQMSYGCTKMVHFLWHLEILRKFWFWNNTMCGYFGLGGGKTPKQLFVPGFWWLFCRSLPFCVFWIELFAESWECRCSHGRSGMYEDVFFIFSGTLSCWARYIGIIEKSQGSWASLTSFLPWRSRQAVEKKAVSLKRKHLGYGDIPFWNRSYFTWMVPKPLNFSHSLGFAKFDEMKAIRVFGIKTLNTRKGTPSPFWEWVLPFMVGCFPGFSMNSSAKATDLVERQTWQSRLVDLMNTGIFQTLQAQAF